MNPRTHFCTVVLFGVDRGHERLRRWRLVPQRAERQPLGGAERCPDARGPLRRRRRTRASACRPDRSRASPSRSAPSTTAAATPEPDAQGRFVVFVGERVDFDSTQKNAAGDICAWSGSPTWFINDRDVPEDTVSGVVLRRGSSQPFLLKLTMQGTGNFSVRSRIDGVDSNTLEMRVRAQ